MSGNKGNKYTKIHSVMFPIDLPLYIFSNFVKDEGIVADPFLGLGSSGIAAKMLGLSFIGVELDKEYFEITKKRIKDTE